jgi:hypothetical protein
LGLSTSTNANIQDTLSSETYFYSCPTIKNYPAIAWDLVKRNNSYHLVSPLGKIIRKRAGDVQTMERIQQRRHFSVNRDIDRHSVRGVWPMVYDGYINKKSEECE